MLLVRITPLTVRMALTPVVSIISAFWIERTVGAEVPAVGFEAMVNMLWR